MKRVGEHLDIGMNRRLPPGQEKGVQVICLDNEPLVAATG